MAVLKNTVVMGDETVCGSLSVNGSISEGGVLLGSKYQAKLSMANDNIQLTGSQLGLSDTLTGISKVSGAGGSNAEYISMSSGQTIIAGSTTLIDGTSIYIGSGASTSGAIGNGIFMSGSEILVGSYSTSKTALRGSTIGIDATNIFLGTGTYSGGSLSGPGIMIFAGSGVNIQGYSLYLYAGSGYGSMNIQGNLLLSGYDHHYISGSGLTINCSGYSGSINLLSTGANGSINLSARYGIAISAGSGTAYISGKGHKIEIISGGMNMHLSGTGSLNINNATGSGTTYLWGSVIARNTGIKLATSGSTVGCTLSYDSSEGCVEFVF